MKLKVTNNRQAPYGIEQVGGGFIFVQPGDTRLVDAANPGPLYDKPFLYVEAADSEVTAPPSTIKAVAARVGRDPLDHDGKDGPGGSLKGRASTAAKGARRRRKAAKR